MKKNGLTGLLLLLLLADAAAAVPRRVLVAGVDDNVGSTCDRAVDFDEVARAGTWLSGPARGRFDRQEFRDTPSDEMLTARPFRQCSVRRDETCPTLDAGRWWTRARSPSGAAWLVGRKEAKPSNFANEVSTCTGIIRTG
uniref:(northern house mosquito) hypothetical protein n=1 Tax=Culex pipiens TaxID=7175 RepID=A0A8D8NVC9_CULPI